MKRNSQRAYTVWHHMHKRCYSPPCSKYPWYGAKGVTVDEEWHDFANFSVWYDENYFDGSFLDKDLKVLGNNVYSSKTCEFIPREINALLTNRKAKRGDYPLGVHAYRKRFVAQVSNNKGSQTHLGVFDTPKEAFLAYKEAKEEYIKYVAKKTHTEGKISDEIFYNLMNYKIIPFPEEPDKTYE